MKISCTGLLLFSLMCWSTVASAVDGTIEISQVGAMAGDPAIGDSPGFPVTLATPGSYILTSDLDLRGEPSPGAATAIDITADFVWLNLNGFSIIGPFQCSGSPPATAGTGDGIVGKGHHITVKDGQVRGIGRDGITLGEAGRVQNVVVTCSGRTGISVSTGGVVTNSQVDQSGDFGVDLGDGAGFGGNVVNGNDGAGAGLDVTAGSNVVELQTNSCSGSPTCGLGAAVTDIVPVVCANNITGDLTELPFELTVDPSGPVAGGAAFNADVTVTGKVPALFLQVAVNTIPGLTTIDVTAFQATVTVRRGATWSPR